MSYRTAKADMIRRWTPLRNGGLTVCAMCGLLGRNLNAHHWLESRRFEKHASYNLVPVHNYTESDCHHEAHTKHGKLVAANTTYLVWGQGDREAGRRVVETDVLKKRYRRPPRLPPVSDDEEVLTVCQRIANHFGWVVI